MQFISTEDMKNFTDLGYTFTSKYTPCNVGSTYHVIVTDKDGNEVVHTQCSYGNGSGHGYAMSGAITEAVAKLKEYIENPNKQKEEDLIDWEFLNNLANWDYIREYGLDKNGILTILFDTWEQLEGEEDRPSVFAKFVSLAEKGLLKDSINYTLTHFESAFTDEWGICSECGRIVNRTWGGLRWVEDLCEEICDDCINENERVIEALIEEAKDDFKKALPVMISEDKLTEMGYEKLDTETDFSTRYEQWHEENWGCHNVNHSVIEELCEKYNGFPKLTGVWQFDAEYNAFFPTSTIGQAREELAEIISK